MKQAVMTTPSEYTSPMFLQLAAHHVCKVWIAAHEDYLILFVLALYIRINLIGSDDHVMWFQCIIKVDYSHHIV